MAAATTRSRLPCMLPLASIRSPTVAGASWLAKKLMVWGCLFSKTLNASFVRPLTFRPPRSVTVTCRTTSSDVVEKIGASCAAVAETNRPTAGQEAVTTSDITSAMSGTPGRMFFTATSGPGDSCRRHPPYQPACRRPAGISPAMHHRWLRHSFTSHRIGGWPKRYLTNATVISIDAGTSSPCCAVPAGAAAAGLSAVTTRVS